MANRERGEVALEAGGKTYILRLSYNAIADIEDLMDKGIDEISAMLRDPKDFRISTWRAVLWGALHEMQPDVDLLGAGEIMGKAGVAAVVAKLGEAMTLAFPEHEENPPKASRGAGRKS